ncbi:MAG: hypothetical protein J5736_02130 [Bacilli bacterium]|nr:hypothetical protein [Bacilli bacterium]
MPKKTEKPQPKPIERKIRPALTPEARENQLIALAVDRVEQRLLDGTATSQEIIHFLRLGSIKEQLEMEKLKKENELLKAKTEAIQSAKNTEQLFAQALAAMKSYGGNYGEEEEDDEYED